MYSGQIAHDTAADFMFSKILELISSNRISWALHPFHAGYSGTTTSSLTVFPHILFASIYDLLVLSINPIDYCSTGNAETEKVSERASSSE